MLDSFCFCMQVLWIRENEALPMNLDLLKNSFSVLIMGILEVIIWFKLDIFYLNSIIALIWVGSSPPLEWAHDIIFIC